jgi:NADPH-dependent ferric siderophore reductase
MTFEASVLEKVRSKFAISQATVHGLESIAPNLLTVQVALDHVDSAPLHNTTTGAHIAVAVDGQRRNPLGRWRRFTESEITLLPNGHRLVAWVAFIEGDRPAANFHRSIQVGDRISIRHVDGGVDLGTAEVDDCSRLVCIGDETAIGFFTGIARSATIPVCTLLMQSDSPEISVQGAASCHVAIDRCLLLRELSKILDEPHDQIHFVVVGEKSLVGEARQLLRSSGVNRSHISTRIYWSPGKVGPE